MSVPPQSKPPQSNRRTFAIISHPDAGKTTLTEKFLLYGNAIHLAGAVKDRKNQRATASDWMELEKQRGISISSTVLQFDFAGCAVNLLDTPGHKDFSEDTSRVLTAVGPLQFEVVQWRLQSEYNAESRLTPTPWTVLRWLSRADGTPVSANKGTFDHTKLVVATGVSFGADKFENPVVLFPNEWSTRYFTEKNPELKLHELPLEQTK